jgi:hypothetical protein
MAGVVLLEDVVSISGVQIVHRVHAVLVPGDWERQRPVVVLAGAGAAKRTMPVATRSGALRSGVVLPRPEEPGLRKARWFFVGADIVCKLWTPGSAGPAGSPGDQRFAGCDARFL